MTEMKTDLIRTLVAIQPGRGRAPTRLKFEDGLEVTTFQRDLVPMTDLPTKVRFSYEIRPSKKDDGRVYNTLLNLTVLDPSPPQPALVKAEPMVALERRSDVISDIDRLEQSFKLAVRQRELLEEFVKSRFKQEVHFMDGGVFGATRPVLLQPGAQLILYCHGYSVEFEILSAPEAAPVDDRSVYTIIVRANILNSSGRVVGSAIGSAGSHIYSRDRGRVLRGPDPEKAFNTALKIAQKRALVSACNNCTASSEFFTVDLED